MEKLIFKCPNCNLIKEIFEDIEDLTEDILCPICESPMNLAEETAQAFLADVVEEGGIEDMGISLLELGDKKVWRIIDSFKNPKTRIGYRRLFFKAGGEVPKVDLMSIQKEEE